MEKLFLIIGLIFFVLLGSLVFASIEQIPRDLHTNAYVLGSATYLVAILFLIDLCMNQCRPMEILKSVTTNFQYKQTKDTQTDFKSSIEDLIIPPPSAFSKTILPPPEVNIIKTRILPEPEKPVFAKVVRIKEHPPNGVNGRKGVSQDVIDSERVDAPIYPGFVGRMTRLFERNTARYRKGQLQTIV